MTPNPVMSLLIFLQLCMHDGPLKKEISKVINSTGLLNWGRRPSVLLADFVAALRCSGKDQGAGLLSAPQA